MIKTTKTAAAQALWSHVRTGRSGTGAAGCGTGTRATGAGLGARRTGLARAPTMRPSKRLGRGGFLVFFCRDVSDVTEPWGDGRFGGVRMRSISAAAPLNSWLSSTEAASKRARDAGDVANAVRSLAKLGRALRKKRMAAGALTLASPEVRFELSNESDSPTDVGAYALVEANRTVEEFMLLANVCVASTLAERFPALALLRRHPAPPLERFSDFLEHASRKGFQIDASSSKNLADSLDAATDPSDPELNTLLRIAATRCMAPAAYFCCRDEQGEQRRHYGLAAPLYTHFTSPIRRYADVVVHRLLAAAINDKPLPPSYASRDASTKLGSLATDLNRLATNAQRASRRSVALHTLLFFAKKPMDRCDGRVLAVRDGRLDVLLPQFGVEASIKVDGVVKEGGLAWDDVVVRVFDRVVVRVAVAKRDEDADDAVVLGLVEPAPPRSSGEPAAKRRRA